jgi:CRP-like cAMP-binding protein
VQGSGDLVGGVELLTGRTHRSNAETIEPCQLLVWEASTFAAYWTRFPGLLGNVANILDERLQLLEECFRDVATERVPQRVARTLLRLLQQSGGPACKGPLHLSCEELAQMTGTTLFTVSRLLCQWVEWGILQPEPRAVMVGNLAALINLAKGKEASCYSAETATDDAGAQIRGVSNVTAVSRNIVA